MLVSDSLLEAIELLRNDYQNGSMTIAKKGIEIFFDAIDSLQYKDDKQLQSIAQAIKNAKPTMSALENSIDLCLEEYSGMGSLLSLNQIKKSIIQKLDSQTANCINSAITILKSIFEKPISIITCSYSSTFLALADKLNELSLIEEVFVLESVWKNISYSNNTIEKLSRCNINTREITLSELKETASKIDCAIIGADRLLPDGSVINGIPSLRLAIALERISPFFVIAEKIKFSEKTIVEEGFEIVQNYLIFDLFK